MITQEEAEKMKKLLQHIYDLRSKDPLETSLDGIPGHFVPDRTMMNVAHILGHTDYKEADSF